MKRLIPIFLLPLVLPALVARSQLPMQPMQIGTPTGGPCSHIQTTTWNPSDKNASITLSGGNLTATVTTTAAKGVRSTTSRHTGKWYFRFLVTTIPAGTPNNWDAGIANSTWPLTDFVGQDANSYGCLANLVSNLACDIFTGNSPQGSGGGTANDFVNGDRVVVAVDLDANLGWWTRQTSGGTLLSSNWSSNAGQNGNPSTGANGKTIAGINGTAVFIAWSGGNITNDTYAVTLDPSGTVSDSTLDGFCTWD